MFPSPSEWSRRVRTTHSAVCSGEARFCVWLHFGFVLLRVWLQTDSIYVPWLSANAFPRITTNIYNVSIQRSGTFGWRLAFVPFLESVRAAQSLLLSPLLLVRRKSTSSLCRAAFRLPFRSRADFQAELEINNPYIPWWGSGLWDAGTLPARVRSGFGRVDSVLSEAEGERPLGLTLKTPLVVLFATSIPAALTGNRRDSLRSQC